ncbi:MAG: DUF1552 domain-containing protein [Verrucomicrobiota bacterium]|nr:DUF1552 domain-containing protein [Verrucomicrobiota bacterium]
MSTITTQKWLMNRRFALRGIGVSMALPMLECMRPLRAAEKIQKPKRSVFVYLPNGVNTNDYKIDEAGANYKLSRILSPLKKQRANITPISGLYHPNSFGIAHKATNTWLTGAKYGPTDRNTISVDQLIAGVTGPDTRFPSLELSNQGHRLAVSADGVQLPAEKNPAVVFKELFTEPEGGIDKQRRKLNRRESMLDLVLNDAKSLSNKLDKEDRGRLDQYLTAVREVEIRTRRAESWLETPRPKIDSSITSKLNRNVPLEKLGDYLRTMYDIIVLAFETDMTRVVTFNTGNEGTGPAVPEIGVKRDRHSLSHHNGNKEALEQLTKSDEFNILQFSYFLDRLSEINDVEGKLIDTTVALYGSGLSYGNSHGTTSLPLVLAGGSGLGFKHGKHVDYNQQIKDFKGYGKGVGVYHSPVNPKAHFSNLLLTIAQKMGVQSESFSDSNGETTEVL